MNFIHIFKFCTVEREAIPPFKALYHLANLAHLLCVIILFPFAWRTARDVPKLESLISGGGHNTSTVWTLIYAKLE
jgi:hypothetical protein